MIPRQAVKAEKRFQPLGPGNKQQLPHNTQGGRDTGQAAEGHNEPHPVGEETAERRGAIVEIPKIQRGGGACRENS